MVLHVRDDERLGAVGDLPKHGGSDEFLGRRQRFRVARSHVKRKAFLVGEPQVADADRHAEPPADFDGRALDHLLGVEGRVLPGGPPIRCWSRLSPACLARRIESGEDHVA